MIENYKDLWTKDFNLDAAKKYDRKWWSQCMDNLRHRQQVDLIKPFAKTSRTWLDFPVGSARLMRSIRKHPTQSWHGSDVSDAFLEMSQEILDRFSKQDLLHYKENNYELITCMHALFAFDQSDQEMILHNLAAQLDQYGHLIFDIYQEDLCAELIPNNLRLINIQKHDLKYPWWNKFKHIFAYRLINKAYFKFHLYHIINLLTKLLPAHFHRKWLIVAERI